MLKDLKQVIVVDGEEVFRVNNRLAINSRNAFREGGFITTKVRATSGAWETVTVDFVDGFPDFTPFLYQPGPGERNVLNIVYTGKRQVDFEKANQLAGFARTPPDYTWHHHQKLGRMELVRTEVHQAVSHTGGVALFKAAIARIYQEAGLPVPMVYVD